MINKFNLCAGCGRIATPPRTLCFLQQFRIFGGFARVMGAAVQRSGKYCQLGAGVLDGADGIDAARDS